MLIGQVALGLVLVPQSTYTVADEPRNGHGRAKLEIEFLLHLFPGLVRYLVENDLAGPVQRTPGGLVSGSRDLR